MSHPEYGTNEVQTLKLGHQQIESAAGTPFFNIGEGTNIDEKGQEKQNKSYTFHCHDASEVSSQTPESRRERYVLWITVVLCLIFMICEVIGGIWAQSLAIITDAAHLLTDLASMLISLFSLYIAARPASQRMSFGWHRAEVVGASISVFMIWIVTGILVYLAIERIITGRYEIDATVMTVTASIGVCVNLVMGVLLYLGGGHTHSHSHGFSASRVNTDAAVYLPGGERENQLLLQGNEEGVAKGHSHQSANINIRAAFVHVLGDLIQSVGVLLAGLLILWNEKLAIADPICTLIFSVIVLSTTLYIIKDALVVLLEGRPSHIEFIHVFDSLGRIEGVRKVHELRIWALTVQKIAISVHLEVDANWDNQRVLHAALDMLRRDFNSLENTVQIEEYQPATESCSQCMVPQS